MQSVASLSLSRGIKIVSEASDISLGRAITGIRLEKNCAIRFSLCVSICDYFTNTHLEYTLDHANDHC